MTPSNYHSLGQGLLKQHLDSLARRYQLSVKVNIGDSLYHHLTITQEVRMQVLIVSGAHPEPPLLSFKTRARGFLKALADTVQRLEEVEGVRCCIASVDGQTRPSTAHLRPDTPPITGDDLWKELSSHPRFTFGPIALTPDTGPSVTLSFWQPLERK